MDRNEALDWLCRLRSQLENYMGGLVPKEIIEKFKEALTYSINSLKTDEAYQLEYEGKKVKEVVHAKWIDGNHRQSCSNCKYRGFRTWTYCPNCGAKMAKPQESEDKE